MNHYVNKLVKQYNKYLKETTNSTLRFFIIQIIRHFFKQRDGSIVEAHSLRKFSC